MDGVGDAGDVGVALLDDAEGEHGEVHADDAAADTLPLALAGAAGAVAAVAVGEEQAHTRRVHDALLHREALLVVAARDAEDVALELVADAVAGDLVAHTAVHEDAELALVFDLDQLLGAIVGVRDVELHLVGGCCNVSSLRKEEIEKLCVKTEMAPVGTRLCALVRKGLDEQEGARRCLPNCAKP